jgi:hypothetical protein
MEKTMGIFSYYKVRACYINGHTMNPGDPGYPGRWIPGHEIKSMSEYWHITIHNNGEISVASHGSPDYCKPGLYFD